MPDLPADAITAAAVAIHKRRCNCAIPHRDGWPGYGVLDYEHAAHALEAAAPALRAQGAAAEREACAQLADEVGARYTTHELPDYTTSGRLPMHHRFADLIRARSQPEGTPS